MPETLTIRPIQDGDLPAVIALWHAAAVTRPWNDPEADIDQARRGGHSEILVGVVAATVVASVMVGEDGHRGWVYYLAADPACRRQGLGRAMMDAAERWLGARGIAKLNLLIRTDNLDVRAFYDRLGYRQSEVICLQKGIVPQAAD